MSEISMLLMIDNHDSFTFNVVQYLRELDAEVVVVKNDELSIDQIKDLHPDRIVISPGPCTPKQAGISVEVINRFAGDIPILGVCLGHQSIGYAFGGAIIAAKNVIHGKTSKIFHSGRGVFRALKNPFVATRYHSLVLDHNTLPKTLEITAWTQTPEGELDEIMGVRHKSYDLEGVQFHPESILSECGHELLQNFLA